MASNKRREQILAAAQVVFADKGYHATGVSDIIAKAGIARGTFYLYFDGKRAIFDALLDRIFEDLLARIYPIIIPQSPDEATVESQIRDNAMRLIQCLMEDEDAVKILMAEAEGLDEGAQNRLMAFYGRLGEWLAESLDDGVSLGIIHACNTKVTAHALIGSLRGVLWAWALGLVELDEQAFVNELLAFLRGGLLI